MITVKVRAILSGSAVQQPYDTCERSKQVLTGQTKAEKCVFAAIEYVSVLHFKD